MRNKTIGLIFLAVSLWAVITYFSFIDGPIGQTQKKLPRVWSDQIDKLNQDIKNQLSQNEKLLNKLIEASRSEKKLDINDPSNDNQLPDDKENEINDDNNNNNDDDDDINKIESFNDSKTETKKHLEKLHGLAQRRKLSDGSPIIAILVFSCNRITVQRCLNQLIKYRPSADQFPIIVSQDCEHEETAKIIKSYDKQVYHIRQPDQSDIDIPPREKKFRGYFKIARHYGWALNQIFLNFNFETTIIVEDDLDISPDFFEYFLGTYPLLVNDKSLWCVSAWNDNGKRGLVDENSAHLLYRTDFFPGLGWMLTKDLWLELSPKWPKSYWDDWIRKPEQRNNRACIRPELSRTRTFGKIGVSNGMFFEKHLKYIKLNEKFVPFTNMNLTYLLKDNYDMNFVKDVYQSTVVSYSELKNGQIKNNTKSVRIPYHTRQTYKGTAKMLGLMDDFRSGVPRTGYRGVVTFFYNNHRVYLAPSSNWNGYDPTWS